jgi:N-acetylglucosamine malate deacetylase 1
MFKNKKILALAAHPDDIEFSCGATMKRLSELGNEIHYAVFSPCNKSLPDGMEDNVLFQEMVRASQHMGISKEKIYTYDYPVREFYTNRQNILEDLIVLKKKIRPDVVFIPNSNDIHQDHQVMHNEGVRAFKHSVLLGYELPWNNLSSITNFFFKLEKAHLEAKVRAIDEYKSQNSRFYKSADFYYSLAKVRGTQINEEYAECFEWIRGSF